MKYIIMSTLIALCWMSPLAGAAEGLKIWNSTSKTTRLTLSSANQKKEFGTATLSARKNSTIKIPSKTTQLHALAGSLIPARKQMTPIEPLKGSRGWLYQGHDTYTPLLKPHGQIIPDGATSTYMALMNEKGEQEITRIDTFPERMNESDTAQQTLSAPLYAESIDPKSHLFITESAGDKPHLMVRAYDPKVVKKAAAIVYQNKLKR
jgi:hypothetical protein